MKTITRKQFLKSALGTCAAALGVTMLSACSSSTTTPVADAPPKMPSGSGGGGSSAGQCQTNGTDVTITANHGHVLVVSKEDVAAGTDKTYDIQGSADHPHSVTITAAQFSDLQSDHAIMTQSTINTSATFGTHNHPVMVACA